MISIRFWDKLKDVYLKQIIFLFTVFTFLDHSLILHQVYAQELILPAPGNVKTGHYEVRYKQSRDWPLAFTTVVLAAGWAVLGKDTAASRVRDLDIPGALTLTVDSYRDRGCRTAFIGVAVDPGHIASDPIWRRYQDAIGDLRADCVSIAALPRRPEPRNRRNSTVSA